MEKFEDPKTETREVKRFLTEKGYTGVKVGHDRGTALGWLHISAEVHAKPKDCYCKDLDRSERCQYCATAWRECYSKIGNEVREFTGRSGDYGGSIIYHLHLV